MANDIQDIVHDFGVDPEFVEFTWEILRQIKGAGIPGWKKGNFLPRTKRECALGCVIAQRLAK